MSRPATGRTCGLIGTYLAGCRCQDCKAAARVYKARERAKARLAQQPPAAPTAHRPSADWPEQAACRNVSKSVFFVEGVGVTYHRAKQICATCTVTHECLQDALATETRRERFGVRGGLSPLERELYVNEQNRQQA